MAHLIQVEQLQQTSAHFAVQNEYLNFGQSFFHPLEVQSLRCDLGSLAVRLQDRYEPLCLTRRLVDPLCPEGLRFLLEAFGVTSCPWQDIFFVGIRQIDDAFLVLSGAHHVVEGVLYLCRRVHVQQLDLRHTDARLICVEQFLQQFLCVRLHGLFLGRQHVVDGAGADNLPEGGLGSILDRLPGRLHGAE